MAAQTPVVKKRPAASLPSARDVDESADTIYDNAPSATSHAELPPFDEIARKMISSLNVQERQSILVVLQQLARRSTSGSHQFGETIHIRLGSLFSGTDLEVPLIEYLFRELHLQFGGPKPVLEHIFSCEKCSKKRSALLEVALPEYLFGDVEDLSGRKA